jgi:hypothetical protein
MPYAIGIILALAACAYATLLRLDRDRAFYPTTLIVIASYYVLFAAMGGTGRVIVIESLITVGFAVAASVGFRRNLWLVCVGLAAHGVLDAFHAHVVTNPGVPAWWPAFCLAFDVAAAGYLAWRLARAEPATSSPRGDEFIAPPRSAPSSPTRGAREYDSGTSTRPAGRQA